MDRVAAIVFPVTTVVEARAPPVFRAAMQCYESNTHEPFLHHGTDLVAAEFDGLDAAQDQIGRPAMVHHADQAWLEQLKHGARSRRDHGRRRAGRARPVALS